MTTGHTAPNQGKSRIARTMGRARIFSESLPFIKEFRGTTVVIKYGGSAMVDEGLRNTFADDVAMLHYVGINPVIVHGGGPRISEAMHQQGVEPQWVEGLRVTDAETIRQAGQHRAGWTGNHVDRAFRLRHVADSQHVELPKPDGLGVPDHDVDYLSRQSDIWRRTQGCFTGKSPGMSQVKLPTLTMAEGRCQFHDQVVQSVPNRIIWIRIDQSQDPSGTGSTGAHHPYRDRALAQEVHHSAA